MHVWMLQNGEPWPLDKGTRLRRTGQLTQALLARGHRVTWWTGSIEHKSKSFRGVGEWTPAGGPTVIALPGMAYTKNISLRRYINYRQLAAGFARSASARETPDLVIASIPCHHLALAGVRYARRNGCVAIVDYRDLWPDIFESALPPLLRRVGLAGEYRVQREAFRLADAIVGISPGYVEQALARAGRFASRFDRHFFLGAFAMANGSSSRALPARLSAFEGRKPLVYVGTFGVSYELQLVLDVARDLAGERNDFVVVVCGSGDQDLTGAFKDHPSAVSLGWVNAAQLDELLPTCRAGLMPFRAGSPQSIPNKAFDYFSAGLPVISSLEGEMEHLLSTRGLGLHYKPGDRAGLRAAMKRILDDEDAWRSWSKNARRFFEGEGNSADIYEDYSNYLEELVPAIRARGSERPRQP